MERTELRIPATTIGPALARAALPTVLPPASATLVADVQLLVSDLVGDAVTSVPSTAADVVRVSVETTPAVLRVEVTTAHGASRPSPGTWPAMLLGRLATRWGHDGDRGHARIWFEIALR
jgi:hypothetical protein